MNQHNDTPPPQIHLPDDRFMATIGYLGILCLVPLILKKDSTFAQHHGKQGLVLLIAWIILWVSNVIPVLGQIVWMLGSIVLIILMILGMLNALQGRLWNMPVLGAFAKQINFSV